MYTRKLCHGILLTVAFCEYSYSHERRLRKRKKKDPNHGLPAAANTRGIPLRLCRGLARFRIRLFRALFDLVDDSFNRVFYVLFVPLPQAQLEGMHKLICADYRA